MWALTLKPVADKERDFIATKSESELKFLNKSPLGKGAQQRIQPN